MNRRSILSATLGLCLVAFSAQAQPPGGGGFGGFGGGFGFGGPRKTTLLDVPTAVLTAAIKLTATQKKQLDDIKKGMDTERGSLFRGVFTPGEPPDQDKMKEVQEKVAKLTTDANEEAMKALDEDQQKKVPELIKTATLFRAVGFPLETMVSVKLSKEQATAMNELNDKQTKSAPKPPEDGDWQGFFPKMQKHRTETNEAAMKILTAIQRAAIEAYRKAHPPRQFRGFGGPGGPGGPGGGAPPPPPGN